MRIRRTRRLGQRTGRSNSYFKPVGTLILTFALAGTLVSGGSEAAAKSANNGGAAIAGTRCAAALKQVADEYSRQFARRSSATFFCIGQQIMVSGRTPTGNRIEVLGNVKTGQSARVSGLSSRELDSALDSLQLQTAAATDDGVACNVLAVSPPVNFRDSNYQAHTNFTGCYGNFNLYPDGIEAVWSAVATWTWRQNLTNRYNHEMRVENTSPNSRDGDWTLSWRVRKAVPLAFDTTESAGVIEAPLFSSGETVASGYTLSAGTGTYFLEFMGMEIFDHASGKRFSQPYRWQFLRFTCPIDPEGQCSFLLL